MAKAKEIEGLDCEASASAGVRLVLRSRLEEMCAFRAAALAFDDPEGVHDMRVASRRLRSLVKDFSPSLRQRKLRYLKEDLKRVADALGAVRDEDVALMALEKLSMTAPPEVSAGFEQFANRRRRERDLARAELGEALTEEAIKEFQAEFNAALEYGLKPSRRRKGDERKAAHSLSFSQTGRDIILGLLRELQTLSASLYRPLKTKPLHRMRLAAKRLRYALELFSACWGGQLNSFAKEIARLQTSLGELHDCDEWIAVIGAALSDGGEEIEGEQAARDRSAAVWLLDYFVRERAGHFRAALARWHEWETTGFQKRLVDTLAIADLGLRNAD
jgi:CHAD domain-containing protein